MAYSTGSPANARAVIANGSPGSPSRTNSPFLVPTSSSVITPAILIACARAARDRPGHDRHDVPRLRRQGAARSAAPTASSTQHFPRPGWVEHDAARDLGRSRDAVAARGARRRRREPGELAAIGITNQRETVGRLGPRDRRAAAPRARLAGPAHGRPLRRAARRRATRPHRRSAPGSCSTRTSRRRRSSGCCDNVDGLRAARRATGAPRSARSTPGSSASSPATHVTDRHERVAHDALRHRPRRLGRRAARRSSAIPERVAARGAAELRRVRHGATARSAGSTACRSAASPATSRRRCSARAASSPGSARTRTAPARSCSCNPAHEPCRRRADGPARDDRLARSARQTHVRARGGDLRHRRRGAVAARRARRHRAGGRDRGAAPASLDSNDGVYFVPGARPASARRTGTRTRAARSSGSRAAATRAHLARAALEAMAYQAVDAVARDGAQRQRAARRAARRRRRDRQPLAHAVPGRRPRRARRGARGGRDDGAGRGAAGRRRRRRAHARPGGAQGERARGTSRAMGDDERESLLDDWHRALERSRGWASE